MIKIVTIIIISLLSGCTSARTIGNSETHLLDPAPCELPGVIERDDTCYQRHIISAKSDAHVIYTKPDGTKIEVNNLGNPSFAHDLAMAVQAIAVQKAITE